MHRYKAGLIAGMMLACTAPATAATLVDTGTPPPSNTVWDLDPAQSLAARFTLTSAGVIDSVLGFIDSQGGSNITVSLHGDGDDIPGSVLFSSSFISGAARDFQGVSGQSWAVGPGSYWVSFASDSNDGMGQEAPSPLLDEAFTSSGDYFAFDGLDLGIRISGTLTGAVPEPASWLLMIGGFGLAGAAMRRRPVALLRTA